MQKLGDVIVDDLLVRGRILSPTTAVQSSVSNLANVVTAQTDPSTGVINKIAKLTQAQYDAIAVKDDSTLYVIVS